MALSSRTITASINYRCAPVSATLMHRGRRAALKTPSDACAEDCRGKLIWPRCPINACSPWCVPIITLRESVLTTKPRQRFSAVTCCTSNVNPPAGFRRYDGKDLNDLFSELWFQDASKIQYNWRAGGASMKIINRFPHAVRMIENCWIPMSDGCRLAARIWLPADAETTPVPAILEYIPYRKRDFTRARDEPMHHYFAGHGYVAVRVDLRGSGDSDGLLLDEYLKQEHDDALEVIRWIARQPWCSGAVG